jgi:hypothetical protein
MSNHFPDVGVVPVYDCFAAVVRRAALGASLSSGVWHLPDLQQSFDELPTNYGDMIPIT